MITDDRQSTIAYVNSKVQDNEPCFVIRANDATALVMLEYWARLAKASAVSEEKIQSVSALYTKIEQYQNTYRVRVKTPD